MKIFLGLLALLLLFSMIDDATAFLRPNILKPIKPETLKKLRQKVSEYDRFSSSFKKKLLSDSDESAYKLGQSAQINDKLPPNEPNPSLNKPLNQTEKDELDSTVFIEQFIKFILTGRYDGAGGVGDGFDDNNLDTLIGLGIILYATVVQEDPPDNAAGCTYTYNSLF